MSGGRKLSNAQVEALLKFADAGGHGFGAYAYLSRATTMALWRAGLVEVGSVASGITWGCVTRAGLVALAQYTRLAPREERSSVAHKPYGWRAWTSWSDADTRAARVATRRGRLTR